jgi:hypothetical protein
MTNYSLENGNKTTNSIIEKKKMPKLWSCIVAKTDEEKKLKQVNKQINAKLKQDEKVYKATYRLLLLGLFYLNIYLFYFY